MSNRPRRFPHNLAQGAKRWGFEEWLRALPAVIDHLAIQWSLTVGEPFEPGGQTAWVAPARDGTGTDVVLKVERRHTEALHEADGLQVWAGEGTVRLLDVAELDHTVALLLERCLPGTPLASQPEPEQDLVVADLLGQLWHSRAVGHAFRPLQSMCDEWADEFEAKTEAGKSNVDPGLARAGVTLFRSLPATADREVLLCTDLHAENVLAAQRQPWLVIDPKPYVGDPTYDLLQHMLNCPARLRRDAHRLVARLADLLGLDRHRVLLWLFARCVIESPDWPELADVARSVAPT